MGQTMHARISTPTSSTGSCSCSGVVCHDVARRNGGGCYVGGCDGSACEEMANPRFGSLRRRRSCGHSWPRASRSAQDVVSLTKKVAIAAAFCSTRAARALERFVSVEVADSAQKLTILEGSLRATDDEDAFFEPTTFVPHCKAYTDIPCSCGHVRFDDLRDHHFLPGYERYWHAPTYQKLFNVQNLYRRDETALTFLGPYFWHAIGFGNFKNSMDTSFFIHNLYAQHFDHICSRDSLCVLTRALASIMNWVVTTKQFALAPVASQVASYSQMIDEMSSDSVADEWAAAPWWELLNKPAWAETFLLVVDQLVDTMAADNAEKLPDSVDDVVRFETVLVRLGANDGEDGRSGAQLCFGPGQWPREVWEPSHSSQFATTQVLTSIIRTAFDKRCKFHVVKRLALFGTAARSLLPRPVEHPWPATTEPAGSLPGRLICRLCNGIGQSGNFVHRRVGGADLHFLEADMVEIGGELHLEILWMATSADDSCIMVGANFHNLGDAYYSFAHTLPRAHVEHWNCRITSLAGKSDLGNEATSAAITVSYSGFSSVTTCRLSASAASAVRDAATSTDSSVDLPLVMEVSLSSPAKNGWSPEPFRICFRPQQKPIRKLSACTATLHGADYVHKVMPFAIEDWINYHQLIGVEHFTISDTDGSYEPYLRHFIEKGVVTYHSQFPSQVALKFGEFAAGMKNRRDRRPMLLEAQSFDFCVWENRHVSEWVVAIHSFEEFLHSPFLVEHFGKVSLGPALDHWGAVGVEGAPKVAIFEMFQEPMGGKKQRRSATALSAWTHKRGLEIRREAGTIEEMEKEQGHFQPFSWIVDPLNVQQTAVHFARARAEMQAVVVIPKEQLRLNHYVDFGSNSSRCLEELGGCDFRDESILWAEEEVVRMRRREVVRREARR
eukprot:TRINITY_DN38178_c0_g1_i1.p1 TRINITY_DN38178_c0_g1~~TRINITY_DN38178_c0_g1_i1.p1  ORF type:complete len:897 (+),score=119.28 TRINITY_DN38178_c0_g1_i1:96-2786(+)